MKIKSIIKFLALLVAVSFVSISCNSNEDSPVGFERKGKGEGNQVMSGGGTGWPTLQQLLGAYNGNASLIAVPQGYTLQMAGTWHYDQAYLLVHHISGDTSEIYGYCPDNEYRLEGNCAWVWDQGNTPTSVCCDPNGNTCSAVGGTVIKCDLPPAC